ncbi:cytochrome c3 family protein [Polystyrenella longa]|nr:cytochrome c3 family protein [Polystyrenella longa]
MSIWSVRIGFVLLFLVAGTALTVLTLDPFRNGAASAEETTDDHTDVPDKADSAEPMLFPIEIRQPSGPPVIDLGLVDDNGNPVTATCGTCHTKRKPNPETKSASELKEFHGNLKMAHGNLNCLSCHNAENYDSLKLANGAKVEFKNVMKLCGQCHGPQMKDYENDVHGGMNGFWDRTRGPQKKNNCIDCHHPHTPQFPHMVPTFKPKDRFLNDGHTSESPHKSETPHE